jgi:hypothetical protein
MYRYNSAGGNETAYYTAPDGSSQQFAYFERFASGKVPTPAKYRFTGITFAQAKAQAMFDCGAGCSGTSGSSTACHSPDIQCSSCEQFEEFNKKHGESCGILRSLGGSIGSGTTPVDVIYKSGSEIDKMAGGRKQYSLPSLPSSKAKSTVVDTSKSGNKSGGAGTGDSQGNPGVLTGQSGNVGSGGSNSGSNNSNGNSNYGLNGSGFVGGLNGLNMDDGNSADSKSAKDGKGTNGKAGKNGLLSNSDDSTLGEKGDAIGTNKSGKNSLSGWSGDSSGSVNSLGLEAGKEHSLAKGDGMFGGNGSADGEGKNGSGDSKNSRISDEAGVANLDQSIFKVVNKRYEKIAPSMIVSD